RLHLELLPVQRGAVRPHPRTARLELVATPRAAGSPQRADDQQTMKPPLVEARGMTKRFGALTALDDVSLRLVPGAFHAILGENGAGKSTLVKCMMGYHRADAGHLLVDGTEHHIAGPRDAHRLGFGMVYQHFTLVPSMTVAENLVLGKDDLPAVVRWNVERENMNAFLRRMPFRVDLDRTAGVLAAGEKQKIEILKQLFLRRRVLILDEPTSALTPEEADQVLGVLREMAREGHVTVVLITHKFREVQAFAREVTVLRAGRRIGGGPVKDLTRGDLVAMMIGATSLPEPAPRTTVAPSPAMLAVEALTVLDDKGLTAVRALSLAVGAGEILGVAGVSGNGQRELVEALSGQRSPEAGVVRMAGRPYRPTRRQMRRRRVFVLPEEPSSTACVRRMTVAENLAFRSFDQSPIAVAGGLLSRRALRQRGLDLIE